MKTDLDKKQKLVSIIIPVYNTSDYIKHCLDSVCSQTYRNLEIICIDDGSTDGSGEILDEYAKKDKRIVVIHQKNSGESTARNTGLLNMSGEFVGFVDSDDWIEPEMYENLVKFMQVYDVDIVASNYYKDYDSKCEKMENACKVPEGVMGRDEWLHYVFERDKYKGVTAYIWNKLFKKEFLYRDGVLLMFDKSIMIGCDVYFFSQLMCRLNKVYYTSTNYYHYYQRQSSILHSTSIEIREDILYTYEKILNLFKNENIGADILLWIKRFTAYHASVLAQDAHQQKNRIKLDNCKNFMRKYQNDYELTNIEYPDRIYEFRKILQY
ncbi:glycosyltransferase family 2 protein [Anaerocolumna jejuensis]|uniref:glycosyltransferase family 2 protein n=1 Tax=Anaerocolumna jejuensis TaxID=259063 RepID=UPI003F7C631A